jgi:N-acetyl-beta-hexosaminidase
LEAINIDKVHIYDELKAIKERLEKPFPYRDTDKIQENFNKELSENNVLTADLNSYWMNIAGSLSYILRGASDKIPQGQIEWLHLSFFDIFQQYRLFEDKIADYPSFYEKYINNENARKLLLDYLSYN